MSDNNNNNNNNYGHDLAVLNLDALDLEDAIVSAPISRAARDSRLSGLADLATMDIETSMVADLSGTLHSLFDPICDNTLPIYFGPLLGRLYLEGL